MIGWFLVSATLFFVSFCTKKHSTRRTGLMLLSAWMILSVGMLLLGVDPRIAD